MWKLQSEIKLDAVKMLIYFTFHYLYIMFYIHYLLETVYIQYMRNQSNVNSDKLTVNVW